jgi:RNA polymerase sigma factor (sigma-70 family)
MRLQMPIGRGFLKKYIFYARIAFMTTSTRATLLERIRDGRDTLGWEEFFTRYWPTIYGFARRRGCSQDTAEEVVQEVLLKIFQQRDVYQYDPARGRFRDWLGTVVRHKVAERRRRPGNRRQAAGNDFSAGQTEPAGDGEEVDQAWEAAFENSLLLALLDAVRRETNPRTYLAFELIGLEGLSGSEAARLTGLTRNAVYKAHKRVLGRLVELGAPYRREGRLARQVKRAVERRPPAAAERSLTAQIEKAISSLEEQHRREPGQP